MNKTMGRFIDEATPEMRDRIIVAQAMNDGTGWFDGESDCGCLVGTAYGREPITRMSRIPQEIFSEACRMISGIELFSEDYSGDEMALFFVPWRDAPAAIRYPQAVRRFGLDRVMRAVKMRAAATTSREVERAEVEVAR